MFDWIPYLSATNTCESFELPEHKPVFSPLKEHRLIVIKGPDAQKFLQGQCSCDFQRLDQQEFLLGAHCNIKGRMHASFIAAAMDEESIALRLHHSISESTLDSLKKYIVFSKASIEIKPDYALFALTGNPLNLPGFSAMPALGQTLHQNGITVLRTQTNQCEVWAEPLAFSSLWPLGDTVDIHPSAKLWDLLNIRQGLAEIRQEIVANLLPQELNFQWVNGIAFNKGCYTGQEVIARMHYKAQLKKHMYRCRVESSLAPTSGAKLFSAENLQKAVGLVINSAQSSPNCVELLVLCDKHIQQHQDCFIADISEPPFEPSNALKIQWLDLPYAIP